MSKPNDVVVVSDVQFTWPGRRKWTFRVDRFHVPRRERLLLLGPSGGGKSTLLSLICGIVTPDRGSVRLLGQDLAALKGGARDRFRADHVGVIFQMFNLLPYGSVLDNVLLALSFAPQRRGRAAAADGEADTARRLLRALGLDDAMHGELGATLSVGQQQRVAAARALIGAPEVVVADEPTSSLDHGRQADFLELLFAQAEQAGTTLIMVSHDDTLAGRFDRVVELGDLMTGQRR